MKIKSKKYIGPTTFLAPHENRLVKVIENVWWWNHFTFQKGNAKNKTSVSHSHAMLIPFSVLVLFY